MTALFSIWNKCVNFFKGAASLSRFRDDTQLGTPNSVGLPWTSDRCVAETQ